MDNDIYLSGSEIGQYFGVLAYKATLRFQCMSPTHFPPLLA